MSKLQIRKCQDCNNKSHRMFWDEGCPICEIPTPYVEMSSGGLTARQIEEIKMEGRMNNRRGVER